MKSLSEICEMLPATNDYSGNGVSSVPPLVPQQLKFYLRDGLSYDLWGRVFCHDSFIMVYMISGKRIVNIDDCSYTLDKGELIIIPPYVKHSFSEQYRDFKSLMASFVIPGDSSRLHNLSTQSWRMTRREEKTIRAAIAGFERWMKGDSAAAEETVCHFAILLRQIQTIALPELNERSITDAELPLLNRITAYLASHRHRHVTVAELSRELHVSGSTLRQTFRKKMNVSVGHYQLVQRLRYGLKLLHSTDLTVAEIAGKAGFASVNGFLFAIKRECNGTTPTEFRKQWQNSVNESDGIDPPRF